MNLPLTEQEWLSRFIAEATSLGTRLDRVQLYLVASEAMQRPDHPAPEDVARALAGPQDER